MVLLSKLLEQTSTTREQLEELMDYEKPRKIKHAKARAYAKEVRRNSRYDFKLTHNSKEIITHFVDQVYDDEGRWKLSTDQHCRYDGQPFQSTPVAIPAGFSNRRKQYRVYGCFCSFPCAISFLYERQTHLTPVVQQERLAYLFDMASKYFGQTLLKPALPLECLTIHGGCMEIEEWRWASGRHATVLHEPPLEAYDQLVIERIEDHEERKRVYEFYYGRTEEERQQKEQARQHKLDHDLKQAHVRETSRLRQKAHSSKGNLLSTMGITIVDQ